MTTPVKQTTLDERVARAQVEVANMACAQPHIWPEWQRLQEAKRNLEKAKRDIVAARRAWNSLIAKADPKYKALLKDWL